MAGTHTSRRNPNILSGRQGDKKFSIEIDFMDIVLKSLPRAFWLVYQKIYM
jgi:hypothetical protein